MTCTPRLGEYQTTRGPRKATKPEILDVNLDESSYMLSVKGMYSGEAGSLDLHLRIEGGNNQVVESAKVNNSNTWNYLIELMLDGIRNP